MTNPSVVHVQLHTEYKTHGQKYWSWKCPFFVHATFDAAKDFWRPHLKEGTDFMSDRECLFAELKPDNPFKADKVALRLIEVK